MKRKLFCLVTCIICVMVMLASCGDDNVCTAHADADKNNACDTCGTPVYTVVEKVPTEEAIVDMIVSAIPENATLGTVWALGEKDAPLGQLVKVDVLDAIAEYDPVVDFDYSNGWVYIVYTTQVKGEATTAENWNDEYDPYGYLEDDEFVDTYKVYDMITGTTIYTYNTDKYTYAESEMTGYYGDNGPVDFVTDIYVEEDFFLCVERCDYSYNEYSEYNYDIVRECYLINGKKIAPATDEGSYDPTDFENDGEFAYVTINDTIYVYDVESCALKTQGDVNTFVYRPYFDYTTDAYGYTCNENKVYVFDLSKWIECVYSYELPANAGFWYLDNGNLLVQQEIVLPESAKNYDYTDGACKYDLKYYIVDVAARSVNEIEFGYYINQAVPPIYDDYADSVKNLLTVQEIKNKNLGKTLYLACDDALGILADRDSVLPQFVYNNVTVVADGVYRATVVYGDGSSVVKLFGADGAELSTLPGGADIQDGYIKCNGKYYDFTMKLIFDPAADEEDPYTVYREYYGYLLLRKGADVYYWNATLAAPVAVAIATNQPESDDEPAAPTYPVVEQRIVDLDLGGEYFVVEIETTVEAEVVGGAPVTTFEYKVYNAQNQLILAADKDVDVEDRGEYVLAFDGDDHCYIYVR